MLETTNSDILSTPQWPSKRMGLASSMGHDDVVYVDYTDYIQYVDSKISAWGWRTEEKWMPLFVPLSTGICEAASDVMKSQGSSAVAVHGQDVDWTPHIKAALAAQMAERKMALRHLIEQWERERPQGADVLEMVMHPSYQRIIGMGPAVVPFLLEELEHKPGHWFWALHAITGANPVPPASEGNLKDMAKAWIEWGRKLGYRW